MISCFIYVGKRDQEERKLHMHVVNYSAEKSMYVTLGETSEECRLLDASVLER